MRCEFCSFFVNCTVDVVLISHDYAPKQEYSIVLHTARSPAAAILVFFFFFFFFLIDKFVPSVHSLQEIATRANTNPEAKGKKNTYTRKRECE